MSTEDWIDAGLKEALEAVEQSPDEDYASAVFRLYCMVHGCPNRLRWRSIEEAAKEDTEARQERETKALKTRITVKDSQGTKKEQS